MICRSRPRTVDHVCGQVRLASPCSRGVMTECRKSCIAGPAAGHRSSVRPLVGAGLPREALLPASAGTRLTDLERPSRSVVGSALPVRRIPASRAATGGWSPSVLSHGARQSSGPMSTADGFGAGVCRSSISFRPDGSRLPTSPGPFRAGP